MRLLLVAIAFLLSSCASIEDLTRSSCVPTVTPRDVILKREAYLYQVEDEPDISLWDSPRQYGQGLDAQGHMIIHTPPPLYTLQAGSRLTIVKVTRETHFDNPPNIIHVRGIAYVGDNAMPFLYSWGVGNHVRYAPWESESYNPSDFSRVMECKI